MKKGYIVAGVVLLVIIILVVSGVGTYNTMVAGEETINGEWAKVETQYQRRSDLIPNLVSTVKGYAAHEQSTLDAVVSARAKATQVTLSADNLTPENIEAFQAIIPFVGCCRELSRFEGQSEFSRIAGPTRRNGKSYCRSTYSLHRGREEFQCDDTSFPGIDYRIDVRV